MGKEFHDINSPGFFSKPVEERPAQDAEYVEDKPKADPEVRFSKGEFTPHPVNGYTLNQNCLARIWAEFLKETSRTRITVEMRTTYKGETIKHNINVTANLNEDGYVEVEIPLWYHDSYWDDERDGKIDGKVEYYLTVTHSRHVEPLTVGPLTFPRDSGGLVLKRGHYDDVGCGNYPETCQKGGANYLEGNPVETLQNTLKGFRYNPGPVDGVFGAKTEKAVKQFQEHALGEKRKLAKEGTIVETTPHFPGPVDGIVGNDTRKEFKVWESEKFVKPVLELVYNDFDDQASISTVRDHNKPGERDYYYPGTPVQDMQHTLKDRGFEEVGNPNGDFQDKTKEAITAFQKEAKDKKRKLSDGSIVETDAVFEGKVNGRYDDMTQEELRWWQEQGWYRPDITSDTLIIQLKDWQGRPAAGVSFELVGQDGEIIEEKTDEEGSKTLTGLKSHEYELRVPPMQGNHVA